MSKSMVGFKVDPENPKYDIGTKFLVVKEVSVGRQTRKLGQRYIVEGMDEGVAFFKDGAMVYLLRLVRKNGAWCKRQFRIYQDVIEFDLCDGTFEVLEDET